MADHRIDVVTADLPVVVEYLLEVEFSGSPVALVNYAVLSGELAEERVVHCCGTCLVEGVSRIHRKLEVLQEGYVQVGGSVEGIALGVGLVQP